MRLFGIGRGWLFVVVIALGCLNFGIAYGQMACITPPLIVAVEKGDIADTKRLLADGVEPDTREECHNTPAVVVATRQNHREIVEILIAAGANLSLPNSFGNTALLAAVHNDNLEILDVLIKAGADVNQQGYPDLNVGLHYAARDGKIEVAKILIAAGAVVHLMNRDYQTPLYLAKKNGHADVVEYLNKFPHPDIG